MNLEFKGNISLVAKSISVTIKLGEITCLSVNRGED